MGPEESMQIQSNLASTIAMAFDECPPSRSQTGNMCRIVRGAYDQLAGPLQDRNGPSERSAGYYQPASDAVWYQSGWQFMKISVSNTQKQIAELDLDGYAVGGLAVGETHEEMYRILDAVVPYLPVEQTDLSDGCWNTGQYSGSGGSRRGFLRLCISQPEWPSRSCLYELWQN